MITKRTQAYNLFFRQLLFLAILLAVGLVILDRLGFFIGSFLGAITAYVVLRKVNFHLVEQRRWNHGIAALAQVLALTVVLLGIGFLFFEVTASQVPKVDMAKVIPKFNAMVEEINGLVGFKMLSRNLLTQSSDVLTKIASKAFTATYSVVINVFLLLVILYFMLSHARKMEQKILMYQPFRGDSLELMAREAHNMIFSNAVGIPAVMFTQGLVAWLIYWLLGVPNAVFWAFLTALGGLIPMIGTAIVSVPLGIWLISTGGMWQGIVLIFCGLFVIANVDNLFRIVLLKKVANTPPLIVIFGVILGIPLFGFWGIIFGPLLISGFLLLIKIYYHEYGLLKRADPDLDPKKE